MMRIGSLKELRQMPDSTVKMRMEARALSCDDDLLAEMEEESDSPLGGDWYLLEEGDDPRNFFFDEGSPVDLLSDDWNWCDFASLEEGCFFIFWGTNDAGGPCLFVADEPWIPAEFRAKLVELI